MRLLENKDLVGKKIVAANTAAVNVTHLTFEDGSTLSIWAEMGPVGVPELMVDDDYVDSGETDSDN